jgi:hypothetical protein
MWSSAGVGMTPPKVLGTPKPLSSVMMSKMLGAPLGGSTRGGHHGFDCTALRSILPPNFGGGGGSCFPLIVVVALGEPGTPVIFWAIVGKAKSSAAKINASAVDIFAIVFIGPSSLVLFKFL